MEQWVQEGVGQLHVLLAGSLKIQESGIKLVETGLFFDYAGVSVWLTLVFDYAVTPTKSRILTSMSGAWQ